MHIVELGYGVSAAALGGCTNAIPPKIANLFLTTVTPRRRQIQADGLSPSRSFAPPVDSLNGTTVRVGEDGHFGAFVRCGS